MARRGTVWSIEVFDDGHWSTVEGGMTKLAATKYAKILCKRETHPVSIAEYEADEGSSAIKRELF